jgi:hypothetical protein
MTGILEHGGCRSIGFGFNFLRAGVQALKRKGASGGCAKRNRAISGNSWLNFPA